MSDEDLTTLFRDIVDNYPRISPSKFIYNNYVLRFRYTYLDYMRDIICVDTAKVEILGWTFARNLQIMTKDGIAVLVNHKIDNEEFWFHL